MRVLRNILAIHILSRCTIVEGELKASNIVFETKKDLQNFQKITNCEKISEKMTIKKFTTVRGSTYEVKLSLHDAKRMLRSIIRLFINDTKEVIFKETCKSFPISGNFEQEFLIIDGLNLHSVPNFEGFMQDWLVGRISMLMASRIHKNQFVPVRLNTDYILTFLNEKLKMKYSTSDNILQRMFNIKDEGDLIRHNARNMPGVVGIKILSELNYHR